MLQLNLTALFYHFFVFFAFLPQCKAFLTVNDPTPAQGSDFFPGQSFTLRWSGSSGRSSTMNIELWDWDGNKLRKKWDSIAISSMSLSDTLPDIPSGKYYFWCGDSERNDKYGESGDFFVTLAPVTATDAVTTTATTTFMRELPTPPATTRPSQPSQTNLLPPPTSSGPLSASGIINTSSVSTSHHSHSTSISMNLSTGALPVVTAMSAGPTDWASGSQPNSSVTSPTNSSSTTLGSPPVGARARSNHIPTGAIVGGTLGGAVILFAILAFVIIRRRSNLKESRTYIPMKAMAKVPEEQQKVISDLERNVAENSRNDSGYSNGDEQTQRLISQMEIMNARVRQLEIQELERQSAIVDLLSPPPMYSSVQQSSVNQGTAAFVMHKSALPSARADTVDM